MKIETIITALRRAVATYEVLSMKSKPGKKGRERLADFQKILYRIESRSVEPAEAIAWVYDFCERHGNKPRLVHCLLIELSKIFNMPLVLSDTFQQEIKNFSIDKGIISEEEIVLAGKIIRDLQEKLDFVVSECRSKLGLSAFPELAMVKLTTVH